MQYQGGKSRIASEITAKIRELHPQDVVIHEPFAGGGAMTLALAKAGFAVAASDTHPDLIQMWQAFKAEEWSVFGDVTEEEYQLLRHAQPSARRGFVGFGASFGGKFMGGMGRHHRGEGDPQRQYVWQDSVRSLAKMIEVIDRVEWRLADYRDTPDDALTYCDPPYLDTYAYQGREFDHVAFWGWVLSRTGPTFVSELTGPEDLEVWRKQYRSLASCNAPKSRGTPKERTERLFYKPRA